MGHHAGQRQGTQRVLNATALEDMAVRITFLQAVVDVLGDELGKRDRALERMSIKLEEAYELITTRAAAR
jgi:hypothetical protein